MAVANHVGHVSLRADFVMFQAWSQQLPGHGPTVAAIAHFTHLTPQTSHTPHATHTPRTCHATRTPHTTAAAIAHLEAVQQFALEKVGQTQLSLLECPAVIVPAHDHYANIMLSSL